MALLDPFSLSPVQVILRTRIFTDPRQPGAELTLTLRVEAGLDITFAVQEKKDAYVSAYLRPSVGADGKPVSAAPLMPVDGKRIAVSENLFDWISMLQTLQVVGEGEQPYDLTAWLTLLVRMPQAIDEAVHWANDLLGEARGKKGEDSSDEAETSPAPVL